MSETTQITFTFAGRTETVEATVYGDRAFGPHVLYGVFPTGKKAHRTGADFFAPSALRRAPSRYDVVGTDPEGREWVLSQRLYTHNRNVGRIVGWSDEVDAKYVARW